MYTIGQMSQLCHISARRLRYFEAMGILKPAMLSEKGVGSGQKMSRH